MTPDEKIKIFRKKGYTDDQIATYFRAEFKKRDYTPEQVEQWLQSKKLREEKIEEYTFGDKLSQAFRGFGKDVASGVGSGLTLAKMGTGVAGQALSLPMAYAGGSAGQNIEDITRGEQPKTWGEAIPRYHKAGMKGLKDELVGGPIGKLLSPAAKPFSKRMGFEDMAVEQFSKKEGLPLSASSIVESRPARMLEWSGDALTIGKVVGDAKRTKLKNRLEAILERTKSGLTTADKGVVGEQFAKGLKEAQSALYKKTSKAYDNFGKALRDEIGDSRVEMSSFIDAAEKWRLEIDNDRFPKLRQFLASISDRRLMTGKEIDMFQKQIWDMTYPKHSYIGGELWEALQKDLDVADSAVWARLQDARQANRLKKSWHKNPVVRATAATLARGDTDRVILNAFRAGNMEAINAIKIAVPKGTFDIASERFVRNILDAGVNPSTGEFAPERFLKIYGTYKKQIENVMPEMSSNLDIFAETLKRALPDIKKGGTSQMGMGLRMAMGGGAAAAAYGGSPTLLIPEGFSAMLAHSMRAPRGMFKKWLTTGYETEKMLRLGGRFIDMNKGNDQGNKEVF